MKGGDYGVKKHYNLYYLFEEDKVKHPMPSEAKDRIRKNLQDFFKKIKPP